jgi:hypothetical protein
MSNVMNQKTCVLRLIFAAVLVLVGTINNKAQAQAPMQAEVQTPLQAPVRPLAVSRTHFHTGFDVSFGRKSFLLSSDLTELNQLKVLEEGGSGGVVIGNDIIELKLRQGYYYSASRVAYTVDLVESEANVTINLFSLLTHHAYQLQPYALFGVARNAMSFYGFYANKAGGEITDPPASNSIQKRNYSVSQPPFTGKVIATRATAGLGLSYSIPMQYSFVKVYSEVNYGYAVDISSELLKNTTVANQFTMNLGVSFGLKN